MCISEPPKQIKFELLIKHKETLNSFSKCISIGWNTMYIKHSLSITLVWVMKKIIKMVVWLQAICKRKTKTNWIDCLLYFTYFLLSVALCHLIIYIHTHVCTHVRTCTYTRTNVHTHCSWRAVSNVLSILILRFFFLLLFLQNLLGLWKSFRLFWFHSPEF